MSEQKKGLANVSTKSLEIPKYLQDVDAAMMGVDTIEAEDIQIPRLKILQGSSKIKTEKPELDLKDGTYYNSITGEDYGKRVEMYVLLTWKSMVLFTEDFKLKCISYKDIKTKETIIFGDCEGCDMSEANKTYNYQFIMKKELEDAVLNNRIPIPMMMHWSSAASTYAKQLNGKFKTNAQRGIPIYGQKIVMTTFLKPFKIAPAYMPQFSYGEFPTEDEFKLLKILFSYAVSLQSRQDVQVENVEEEDAVVSDEI